MGYNTTLTGKLVIDNPVSEEFILWLNKWCHMRHVSLNAGDIISNDKDWKKKTLCGNLGDEGILYAADAGELTFKPAREDKISFLEDYYFPFEVDVVNQYDDGRCQIQLLPSGIEKPYGVENWFKFILGCKDLIDIMGDLHGVILGIGESYGDAWYLICCNGKCERVEAYCEGAVNDLKKIAGDDSVVLKVIEEVAKRPQELEYYWDD